MKKYPILPQLSKNFFNPINSDLENNNLKGNIFRVIELEKDNDSIASLFGGNDRKLFEITDFRNDGQVSSFSKVYEDNELFSKIEFHYDSQNRIEKEIAYDGNGEIIQKVSFLFDSDGRMIEVFKQESDQRFTANYKNGILETVIEVSKMQEYKNTYTLKRNPKNINQITEVILDKNHGTLFHTFFEYDINGNIIKEYEQTDNGEKVLKIIKEYDNFRNPTSITYCRKNGNNVYKFKYEYDEHNNWTKTSIFANDKLTTVTGRRYLYF